MFRMKIKSKMLRRDRLHSRCSRSAGRGLADSEGLVEKSVELFPVSDWEASEPVMMFCCSSQGSGA